MADKSRIKVAVVEGDYAELCGLGLPLSLSLQLQCLNLKLSGALWSAKASASGFSVSLYWPTTDTTRGVPVKVKKARKNRKRRHKQAPTSATNNQTASSVPVIQSSSSQPLNFKTVCLNKEHPSPDSDSPGSTDNSHHSGSPQYSHDVGTSPAMSNDSSEGSTVDLAVCSNVQYGMKDGVHGVSYTSHLGERGWTPVIGRKKKRTIPDYIKRRFPRDHPIHKQESDAESESDEQDLDNVIPGPAGGKVNIEYRMVDNIPGLSIKTRNTQSWTPVAARTRARLRK